jgi:hypothetical protein
MRQRVKLAGVLAVVSTLLLPAPGVDAGVERDGQEKFVGVANVKTLNIVCRRGDDKGKSTVRLKIKVTRKVNGVPRWRLGDDNGWGDRGHIEAFFPGGKKLVLHRFNTFYAFPKHFEFPKPDSDGDVFKIRLRAFKRFFGHYRRVGHDDGFILVKLRCVKPAS